MRFWTSDDGNPAGKVASAGKDSLVPVPGMLSSVSSKSGGPSPPVLGGDSLTGCISGSTARQRSLMRRFARL